MSELVFLSGDFCSGSTLMFTLFRNTEEFYALYEPFHARIREYQIWRLRPYEHHFHVDSYFDELRGFRRIPELFDPSWCASNLMLEADDEAPALKRYLDYLIEEASRRSDRIAIKENRFAFRLGWLRQNYPDARIIHIHRRCEGQWSSILRRVQSHHGRTDVGQDDPRFNGFRIAEWCDDLAPHFPDLAVEHSATGYERFSKLWAHSLEQGQRHSHLAVSFEDLTRNFDEVWGRIALAAGSATPASDLAHLVVPPERAPATAAPRRPAPSLDRLIQRAGTRYAQVRVAAGSARRRYLMSRT